MYENKGFTSFNDTTSTGIDKVPLNSYVTIENSDGNGNPRMMKIVDKTGLTDTTTIADFINNPTLWKELRLNADSVENPKISYISDSQHNNLMMLIDGNLYTASGNSGANNNSGTGRGLDASVFEYGVSEARLVTFPDETTAKISEVGGDGIHCNYALFDNGNLYTWGYNGNGCLGLGHTTSVGIPTLCSTNVSKVWSTFGDGYNVSNQKLVVQKTDGYIYGCGENGDGDFGLGTTGNLLTLTQLTWVGTNPKYFYSSNAYGGMCLAQKSDGTIWTAGYQNQGALFNGVSSTTALSTPVDITASVGGSGAGDVIWARHWYAYYTSGVVVASSSMLMRKTDAGVTSVWHVGDNGWGQRGNGTVTDSTVPYSIPNMSDIADIAWNGGSVPTLHVLKTNGDLYGWGHNGPGQVGAGTTVSVTSPTLVETGVDKILSKDVSSNTYGYNIPVFILKGGYVYGAGYNASYHLGVGDTANKTTFTRLNIPSDDPVKMIGSFCTSSSGRSTVAITENNNVWVWGYNAHNSIIAYNANHIRYPTKIKINSEGI